MSRGKYQSVICHYGYRKGANGRLEIDPEAAEVVKLIFEQALTMKSTSDIIKALYERNIPTPGEYRKAQGKNCYDISRSIGIWPSSTVLHILEDER
jgi:DNA invertase Pin-like site-specific DNA recombinase